jgi:DNA-binding transcriptional ArsR family regulator
MWNSHSASAIAEPTRLASLGALVTGEKTVTQLAKECGIESADASRHLNLMKSVGLVSAERDGRFMRYNLVSATVAATLLDLTHESGSRFVFSLV